MAFFLLKVDAFANTFSMVEAGRQIRFEYSSAVENKLISSMTNGDKVLGYSVMNATVNSLFTVVGLDNTTLLLRKDVDVAQGTSIEESLGSNVNANGIIELSSEEYHSIYANLVDDLLLEHHEEEDEVSLPNCLQVQRAPRQNKVNPLNFIIYGAPGTGKTYSTAEYALAIVNNRQVDLRKKTEEERKAVMTEYKNLIRRGQVVFTTFHQSYGYEEFIQGLRPDTQSEKMSFKTVDGVFKHIADIALNDFERNYVIIIDEINRANISKVFGELITLIEEDKRWGETNEMCATLQSGDIFAVPNNLYIVGTMNSADKSISLIDAALRRRFEFIEQKPDPDLVENQNMRMVLSKMNSKLTDELDSSDLLIGHSYFMNRTEEDLLAILNNNIIPLLYEYFYDNKKRVANVLDYSVGDLSIEIVDDKMGRLSVKKKEE